MATQLSFRAWFLIPVLLGGCTPTPYRIGVRAANDGRYVEATTSWLQALDEDIYALKPRKALREHAQVAWNQLLDDAREHEASRRYEESIAAYDRAMAYTAALDEAELLSFSTADAIAERADVMNDWALSEQVQGSMAHDEQKWSEAVDHFDRARELRSDLRKLDEAEGASFSAWAREDLEEHRYHKAAEHFRRAYELTDDREMDAWTAAVEVGLGRYSLQKGGCRAAVEHFERAGHVVADGELPADLERALDCSRLGLLLDPVEEMIRHEGGELALGSMLLGRIEKRIGEDGSRYVRILATDVLSSIENPPTNQVRVTITVSQANVEKAMVTRSKMVTNGERVIDCDQETLLYTPDAVCTQTVEVEYSLHRTAQTVRLSGSVKTVDLRSGEQSTHPLDVRMTHDTTHARGFRLFEAGTTVAVQIGTQASVGRIELPEAIVALDREPMALPASDEMLVDAVRSFAIEAATSILSTVDQENSLPKPRSLVILQPVLNAADVQFHPSSPVPEPVEEPIE